MAGTEPGASLQNTCPGPSPLRSTSSFSHHLEGMHSYNGFHKSDFSPVWYMPNHHFSLSKSDQSMKAGVCQTTMEVICWFLSLRPRHAYSRLSPTHFEECMFWTTTSVNQHRLATVQYCEKISTVLLLGVDLGQAITSHIRHTSKHTVVMEISRGFSTPLGNMGTKWWESPEPITFLNRIATSAWAESQKAGACMQLCQVYDGHFWCAHGALKGSQGDLQGCYEHSEKHWYNHSDLIRL